jgi:hypothetical protein
MKVIIAGSRNFNDYDKLFQVCTRTLLNKNEIEIVSGTANGADKLGEKFAIDNGYSLKKFPANWEKFGIKAGSKRNAEMGEYADGLIAFWDGKSKGTKNMIALAKRKKLRVRIVYF